MDARDVEGLRQRLYDNGPVEALNVPLQAWEDLAREDAVSKYRQPMAAAPKPFTSRIVEGRRPRTTSQHALWEHYQQAMAQASRECAANFLHRGVRVPSRSTRRAVDAITRKCLRNGLLKRVKKPEDPADG